MTTTGANSQYTQLPYCLGSGLPYPDDKETCQYYENVGLLTTMESSVVVTTRVTERPGRTWRATRKATTRQALQ